MKNPRSLFLLMLTVVIPSFAQAQGVDLEYKSDTAHLRGYYVPSVQKGTKDLPGILILPAWMGITDHEKTTAERLSKLGYNALVADIYGEKIHPSGPKEAGALSGYYKKNYAVYQERIKAALEALKKQGTDPAEIVVIGYCFGGTGALEVLRAGIPVKGIVTFHGGLAKDSTRKNTPIQSKVLVLHGADDPYVPQEDVMRFQKEMKDGKADWQMVYYANAVHGFTDPASGNDNSKGAAYNKQADERSWKAMLVFLEELKKKN